MTTHDRSYAVVARDLVKTYPKGVRALDGLTLSVPSGQIRAARP
jgi:ABC-type multidrug transport system ATPase subunit